MALGNPNITIGTTVYRPTATPGVYTFESADPRYRNQLIISSVISNDKIRAKVELLNDYIPEAASGNVEKTMRVYAILEMPDHSLITSAVANTRIGMLSQFLTAANVDAIRRGEY